MGPVPADSRLLTPLSGNGVGRSLGRHLAWNAVSKTATCACVGAHAAPVDRARARRVVKRRDACASPSIESRSASSIRVLAPRAPARRRRRHGRRRDVIGTNGVERLDRSNVVLVNKAELEGRRSSVDDENRMHASERPGQVADVRVVVAVLARVCARFQAPGPASLGAAWAAFAASPARDR